VVKGDIITREATYVGRACGIKTFVAEPLVESPPAVIVVQEWWGLNEHIRDIARRLARAGYFAVAPDLYSRQGHQVATDANEAARLMGGLKKEDGIADLRTTIEWLRAQEQTHSARIGITGFCMGGSYALLLPCESREIAAAAPFTEKYRRTKNSSTSAVRSFTPTTRTTDGSSGPMSSAWRRR